MKSNAAWNEVVRQHATCNPILDSIKTIQSTNLS